jgi:ATP-dependent helicase HrpB
MLPDCGWSCVRVATLLLVSWAGLPGAAQQAALSPVPRGHRKVVVATNIAETSLTLEGVV